MVNGLHGQYVYNGNWKLEGTIQYAEWSNGVWSTTLNDHSLMLGNSDWFWRRPESRTYGIKTNGDIVLW